MLAEKLDYSSPIERALFLLEGESPTISIGKEDANNYTKGSKHICCADCKQPTVEVRTNAKGEPAPWCLSCNVWTKARLMLPRCMAVNPSRKTGRSKPPISDVALNLTGDRNGISREALDWLLWGHGATYRGDLQKEEAKRLSLVWAVYMEMEQANAELILGLDKSPARAVGAAIDIVGCILSTSRAGRATITRNAMATKLGKHNFCLSSQRPGGRVYDYAKRQIEQWEAEISRVFG